MQYFTFINWLFILLYREYVTRIVNFKTQVRESLTESEQIFNMYLLIVH